MLDRSPVIDRIEAENARLLDSIRRARVRRTVDNSLAHAFAARAITPERGCERKKPYRTLKYAEGVAVRTSREFGRRQTPYFCFYCYQYHLATDRK